MKTAKDRAKEELADKIRELLAEVQAMAEAQGQSQEFEAMLTTSEIVEMGFGIQKCPGSSA